MMWWLKSKAVWATVGLAALAIADALGGDWQAAAEKAAQALGVLGVRHAVQKRSPDLTAKPATSERTWSSGE